jgi:hypothetical protein
MSADQHHLTTALITEAPDIMSATVQTRTNYAVSHLLSAATFSRRLGEMETRHSGQDFGPFWHEILDPFDFQNAGLRPGHTHGNRAPRIIREDIFRSGIRLAASSAPQSQCTAFPRQ